MFLPGALPNMLLVLITFRSRMLAGIVPLPVRGLLLLNPLLSPALILPLLLLPTVLILRLLNALFLVATSILLLLGLLPPILVRPLLLCLVLLPMLVFWPLISRRPIRFLLLLVLVLFLFLFVLLRICGKRNSKNQREYSRTYKYVLHLVTSICPC
jgi:hypothetical protein